MDLNKAFRKAVRAYFEDSSLKELEKSLDRERKYTKAYFDSIEEQFGLSSIKADDEDELKKKDKK